MGDDDLRDLLDVLERGVLRLDVGLCNHAGETCNRSRRFCSSFCKTEVADVDQEIFNKHTGIGRGSIQEKLSEAKGRFKGNDKRTNTDEIY